MGMSVFLVLLELSANFICGARHDQPYHFVDHYTEERPGVTGMALAWFRSDLSNRFQVLGPSYYVGGSSSENVKLLLVFHRVLF